jgi:hypothetical protein
MMTIESHSGTDTITMKPYATFGLEHSGAVPFKHVHGQQRATAADAEALHGTGSLHLCDQVTEEERI